MHVQNNERNFTFQYTRYKKHIHYNVFLNIFMLTVLFKLFLVEKIILTIKSFYIKNIQ